MRCIKLICEWHSDSGWVPPQLPQHFRTRTLRCGRTLSFNHIFNKLGGVGLSGYIQAGTGNSLVSVSPSSHFYFVCHEKNTLEVPCTELAPSINRDGWVREAAGPDLPRAWASWCLLRSFFVVRFPSVCRETDTQCYQRANAWILDAADYGPLRSWDFKHCVL